MNVWESIDYVSQWAKDRREKLGASQSDVAIKATEHLRATGSAKDIKQQSVNQLEQRAHKGVPDWFRFVRAAIEEMEEAARSRAAPTARAKAPIAIVPDLPIPVPDDIEMVREVDIRYAMGDGVVIDDYPETGSIPFNRSLRRSLTNAPPEALFVARGDGDSMMPTLINDDMVLIDTSQTRIGQSDRIWAVRIGDAGMIKRVRVVSKDAYELHSDNPNIRPQAVPRDDLTIVGRVIWVGRRV